MSSVTHDLSRANTSIKTPAETIPYSNSKGQIKNFYFRNNPWKFSEDNTFQRVFRFCVICDEERFSDSEWAIERVIIHPPCSSPLICLKNENCYAELAFLPQFVPRVQYIVDERN